MQPASLIPADTFCVHHNIEYSFIRSMQQYGLVEITTVNETAFIHEDHLNELERFVRLYRELDINPEGIDAISHLLQRVKRLQDDLLTLQNRLSLYEPEG